eukprot:COSAG02_NODE_3259_length_7079_cov_30.942693_5_plen_59_part_00
MNRRSDYRVHWYMYSCTCTVLYSKKSRRREEFRLPTPCYKLTTVSMYPVVVIESYYES